ncbi:MAG: alpha/beta fold hydrolase [Candidatus Kapabacteria bacterium]|nr:alpha/beta fold hydrolase [Candidatus Kapabacteria bacterium]
MEASSHQASKHTSPEQTVITAADGYELATSVYAPLVPNRHVILLNSGTGVKRGYYHKFASFLASKGFTVVTYDYRGIGDSLRVAIQDFDTSISEWGEKDCVAALDWVHERFPEKRLTVVGHSAGGKIPGFAHNNVYISSLVTVAVPNSYWGLWHWWGRRGYFLFVQFIMPALSHLLSYFPSRFFGLGENYPKGVALEWSRWSRRRAYLLHPKRGHFPNYFDEFRGDILALSFTDDIVATGAAAEAFMRFYANAENHTHWHINPKEHGIESIGHSGYFREACLSLWKQLAEWIEAH